MCMYIRNPVTHRPKISGCNVSDLATYVRNEEVAAKAK